MPDSDQKLKLADLVDIDFLQEFQDVFAATTNVASITVDDSGSITKPSNFTEFCIKFTRGSTLGLKKCVECDIRWGKLAAVRGEPVIYKCHTGLTDFAVPIVVNGKHIASILGGQVLTEPPNEEHFRQIARELSIDEDEYIEAVKKIKIVPQKTVDAAAHLLYLVANAISEIGLKNLKLKEKSKRESLYRLIIETVMGTLDVDETKKRVVDIIGKTLNADRCFIAEYDKKTDKFLVVKDEYLSSDKITSYVGADPSNEIPKFAEALKNGKPLIINNKEIALETENDDFDLEKEAIEKFNVQSAFAIPLYYINEFLGVLSIHYVERNHFVSDEEIDLLTMISSQIAILIHQAHLYQSTELRTERAGLYRTIMESIRGSLDIKKTKKQIVEVICKALKADRCFIVDYDKENNQFLTVKDEYLSSEDILPFKGVDVNTEIPNIATAIKNGKNLIINDRQIYLDTANKDFDLEKQAIEKFGVNSAFAFPLYYTDQLLGALAIHYVKTQHTISEDEINLLDNIANQISLAIHQANLYAMLKQKAKDQDAILNNMPFMAWLKDAQGRFLAINEAFSKICGTTAENIVGKTDFDFFPKEYAQSYSSEDHLVMEAKQTLPSEDLIMGPEGERWHETFKSPVFDNEGQVIGTAGISQDITERKEAESKILKAAEREKLSRKIIETIRSTLDIEELFELICKEILDIYNVQRSFIIEYKSLNNHNHFVIRKELKSHPDVLGLLDKNIDLRTVEYWGKVLLEEGNKIVIDNIEESDAPDYFKETYRQIGMKSIMGIAVKSEQDSWGWVGVSQYDYCRHWSEDDVALLESISSQIHIAIHQAELYKTIQLDAQREVILRKTIEAIRSSIDVESVKHEMVFQIGAFLQADRVAFADYDFKKENYVIFEGNEYRSSEAVKTFIGHDFAATPGFIESIRELHLTGKDIIFSDLEIYLAENKLKGTPIEAFYEDMGFQSSMAINISYGENFYGNLVVTFEQKHAINEADVKFLKTLADQSGLAIYQSMLYKKEKLTAQREIILRKTIESIRSSMDVDFVKHDMVEPIGIFLEADRVAFVDYNHKTENYVTQEGNEYRSSENIKTYVGCDFAAIPGFVVAISRVHLSGKEIIFGDLDKYLDENNLVGSAIGTFFSEMGTNACIAINISYGGSFYGNLVVTFEQRRDISEEDVKFLKTLADQAGIAIYQSMLYKKEKEAAEREKLIGTVISKAISTLDINQIKQIVKEIGIVTRADRCYFVEVDLEQMKGMPIDYEGEYLASNDIKSIVGYDFSHGDVVKFVETYINARDIVVFDYEKILQEKDEKYDGIRNYVNRFDLKSGIGIPFIYNDKLTAVIAIEYVKEKILPSDDELEFLRILANQTGMAYEQVQLYQNTKKFAEREALLRSITEKIRSSLDIDETLFFICEETAKLFNVQRSAITSFPTLNAYEGYTLRKEYKSSPEICGFGIGESFAKVAGYWGSVLAESGKVLAIDDIENADVPDEFKNIYADMGIKSIMGTSIKKGKDILGTMVLSEYEHHRKWTEKEKNLLDIVADQIYIAINQAELYNTVQKTAAKERTLREIMLSSVSPTEMHEVLKAIVTDAGKMMKADRCFIGMVDESPINLHEKNSAEYRSSEDIRSYETRPMGREESEIFINLTNQKKIIFAEDAPSEDMPAARRKLLIDDLSVKSYLNVPVFYGDIIYGSIVFHYVNEYKHFTQDEIDVAQAIANQSAIVIHKAKLLELTQAQAQREALLRKTFETMRGSLDIDNIKTSIVTEVCRALGADRCFIIEYDKETDEFLVISDEYLASEEIPSYKGTNVNTDVPNLAAALKRGDNIIINNREIQMYPDPQKVDAEREAIERYNVNSAFAFPLYYSDQLLGAMAIHYVGREHTIVNDEINLLNIIANQISIAIHQAKLYKITQVQAEREKISRNIVEILRSSLDKKTIKRLFVKNIGKYFFADRVFFSDYDAKTKMYVPVDEYSEYLSGPEVKSFIGYDWSGPESREYIQPLLEKRELKIPDWNEYISQNQKSQDFISLFEDANVRSSYNFPVLYQEQIMGYFCIEFTHKITRFSDEDITRIRSMCTQSGIALYQAELFQKVQESDKIKGEFITKISNKFREPLNNIIEYSEILPKDHPDCEKQTEYLNTINETGKMLLDFTNYIAKVAEEGDLDEEN